MEAEWRSIAITAPERVENEVWHLIMMLTSGAVDIVHLRKPGWTRRQLRDMLLEIPRELHPQIRLHDCFDLLEDFPALGGVHLNSRNPVAPANAKAVSCSCHSLDELQGHPECDYMFLSPIYDSISKQGYTSAFADRDLSDALRGKRAIALGGVTPSRFSDLRARGFSGAAMLGALWPEPDYSRLRRATAMQRNFSLQFVTDGKDADCTVAQVYDAVAGGCRWVQIRMKNAPVQEVRAVAERVRQLCRSTGTVLLLDDHVELVRELDVDGVHIGKNDMPPRQAREILGDSYIIGCTANSMEDVRNIAASGSADYIGMGPFRFTTTKKNLAPVLGADGYQSILKHMRIERIALPVVAIGGITPSDVPEIMSTGVRGIAVSGVIAHADNPVSATKILLKQLQSNT